MKTPWEKSTRFREALKGAYEEKKPPEISATWRETLMYRVRQIGPLVPKPAFLPSFEKVVWRLVPVTTPLVAMLVICLLKLGLFSAHDTIFQSLVNSLEEWTLSQFFSV